MSATPVPSFSIATTASTGDINQAAWPYVVRDPMPWEQPGYPAPLQPWPTYPWFPNPQPYWPTTTTGTITITTASPSQKGFDDLKERVERLENPVASEPLRANDV